MSVILFSGDASGPRAPAASGRWRGGSVSTTASCSTAAVGRVSMPADGDGLAGGNKAGRTCDFFPPLAPLPLPPQGAAARAAPAVGYRLGFSGFPSCPSSEHVFRTHLERGVPPCKAPVLVPSQRWCLLEPGLSVAGLRACVQPCWLCLSSVPRRSAALHALPRVFA